MVPPVRMVPVVCLDQLDCPDQLAPLEIRESPVPLDPSDLPEDAEPLYVLVFFPPILSFGAERCSSV